MQHHAQRVARLLQKRFHVILPDAVHIVCTSHLRFVYINICNCVDPVKMQQNPVFFQHLCITVEHRLIFIVEIHQRKSADFVILPERILHISVAEQVRVHCSRNHRGLKLLPRFSKLPSFC